ncbi:MAG TPA: ABC transporter permease, partial [Bacillota bacterium]
MTEAQTEAHGKPLAAADRPEPVPAASPGRRLAAWLRAVVREPYESGLAPIVRKEFADHLTGTRFVILALLVAVTTVASLYVAAQTIRGAVGTGQLDEFVFLRLFTTSDGTMPPFVSFLGFLIPLIGLTLGFDAINGEEARRTLSRLVAQPIHRDAVINGKFLSGLLVIAMMLGVLWLLVSGLGLRLIGVPPTGDEVARLLAFYFITLIYAAFWLSVSVLL